MSTSETIHGGCAVIGEAGLLVRGPSGSGKSALLQDVIAVAQARGHFARLVSDDRTRLAVFHGRLLAKPVSPLAGCLEIRGVGIVRVEHEASAVIRLVADLEESPVRYPEAGDDNVIICGVMVPRLRIERGARLAELLVSRLAGLYQRLVTL